MTVHVRYFIASSFDRSINMNPSGPNRQIDDGHHVPDDKLLGIKTHGFSAEFNAAIPR